jgi:putative ABC transport system substrate-binding protein
MPMRSRRTLVKGSLLVAGLGLLSGCSRLPWDAQPRMRRVGYLSSGGEAERATGFLEGLEEVGYVEGQTIAIERREGQPDRLAEAAVELVRLPVDVLVANGNVAIAAAMRATSTVPIVMGNSASPVEDGFVGSLARPGGNVTGLTCLSRELIGKRLELFKEAVPSLSRVGVLWNPGIVERVGEYQLAEAAAGPLGLELRSFEARDPGELDQRLPMMSWNRPFVLAGGLLAYGPNLSAMGRSAAAYVDKILKGASPADLPVERSPRFDFPINMQTAQALGLTIPPSVLQQATEIIQ